ncbi:transporter [Rhizobium lemnae]|uniref:Transporter n=1 Tax=Rhizobium lemnae TaxID=1214924 RepID=A0ABV8EC11_9HYPH|nr:transporter [Rhizobium lemnae]MCJ8507100.1 transporter [Rhizobium lemnae]
MTNFKRVLKRSALLTLPAISMLTLFSEPVLAVEQGATITPMGITDFGAGILPPSTPYGTVGIRASYYSATTLKDGSGNEIPNNFNINVESLALAYFYMTDMELFGAKVGFGGVLPMISIDGRLNVRTPGGPLAIAGDDFGVGDIQILPLILGWQAPPNMFINAGLQVQAPTGAYSTSNAFNAGTNHWTFTPFLGVTYLSDSGFEISTQATLNFNTVNPDTDYRSGIEYRQEFAIGQHVQDWTFGVAGYAYQQISDDKGPGITDGNRARVFAVGPAISFFKPGLPLVSLHAYKEFGAENRAEGYNVALRVAMSF